MYIFRTFKLMNVNTAPSNPPMIPIITVGIKAKMFNPMPWLICNETSSTKQNEEGRPPQTAAEGHWEFKLGGVSGKGIKSHFFKELKLN